MLPTDSRTVMRCFQKWHADDNDNDGHKNNMESQE